MQEDRIKRELQFTADGSHTLFVPSINEHYHSVNGAVQESKHVFLEAGLHHIQKGSVRILEIGFGTGLNAFLTLQDVEQNNNHTIDYFSVELYPLDMETVQSLNYGEVIWPGHKDLFHALHAAEWNTPVKITGNFSLHKIEGDGNTCELPTDIDLIYFDAFAPEKQPEMWRRSVYDRLFTCMMPGGMIVTYCAKGAVRREMEAAGFEMSRLPGPPGKRHMLRGIKNKR